MAVYAKRIIVIYKWNTQLDLSINYRPKVLIAYSSSEHNFIPFTKVYNNDQLANNMAKPEPQSAVSSK